MFEPISRSARVILFGAWLALVLILAVNHVPWRDEARAFNLTVMGANWLEMARDVQGEGHPVLWYAILRALHDVTGAKEVLGVAAVLIGTAMAAIFVFKAPFRLAVMVLVLFSAFFTFDHVVVARNYGLSGVLLFAIAAWWPKLRSSLWLGVLLLLLCNTNVLAVILAGGIMFYRLLEEWSGTDRNLAAHSRTLIGNSLLLGVGVLACFLTVYPPAHDAAVATSAQPVTLVNIINAFFFNDRSMRIVEEMSAMPSVVAIFLILLLFIRRPHALIAALVTLLLFRAFAFFVYPAFYRHSALFFVFLVSLLWISHQDGGKQEEASDSKVVRTAQFVGFGAFLFLFAMQLVLTGQSVRELVLGTPYSQAGNLARMLKSDPRLRNAIVMGDPDTWLESVAYQTGEPVWFIRQGRFGTVSPLTLNARRHITLDDMLAEARMLHGRTGRPVVILLWARDRALGKRAVVDSMFQHWFELSPEAGARFKQGTRKIASFPPAGTDESYDVYVYPR